MTTFRTVVRYSKSAAEVMPLRFVAGLREWAEKRKLVEIDDCVWSSMRDQRAGAEPLACPIETYGIADMTCLERNEFSFFLHPGDGYKTRIAD